MSADMIPPPAPWRLTKLELYRFLLKLHHNDKEIVFITTEDLNNTDGWNIRINDHGSNDIGYVCESCRVRPGMYGALNERDYFITLDRMGMDPKVQLLFDGAATGRWVDA